MIERFVLNGKEYILIGTAHVSHDSVTEVQHIIQTENPQVVAVELDAERLIQLQQGPQYREQNVLELVQKGQSHLFLLNLFLSNMQRKLGQDLHIRPGEELLAAVTQATTQSIPVLLVDRPVKITLKRTLSALTLIEKGKILMGLVAGLMVEPSVENRITAEKVESLKNQDTLTQVINELAREAPNAKKALIDERDAFISTQLIKAPFQKVVAVVGAGHLSGIKARILANELADEKELLRLPTQKGILSRLLPFIVPALFLIFLGLAFYGKGVEQSIQFLIYWTLITGACSAIGALIARAHPVAILVAFISAPITTLHPALASGWFSAAAESKFRQPKVRDFEGLSQLNSYGDFEKNNVTHLLLVAALTNVGSMIGVLIAFPYLVHLIA